MKPIVHVAALTGIILISATAANGWTLFTTDSPQPPPAPAVQPPPTPPSEIGRYQIIFSPHVERDTFMLDTQTGKIWQLTQYTDLNGQPTVWQYMDRIDSFQDLGAFAAATGVAPKQPAKPPGAH